MSAMEAYPDIIVLACEVLHQIFDKKQSALVEQVGLFFLAHPETF